MANSASGTVDGKIVHIEAAVYTTDQLAYDGISNKGPLESVQGY